MVITGHCAVGVNLQRSGNATNCPCKECEEEDKIVELRSRTCRKPKVSTGNGILQGIRRASRHRCSTIEKICLGMEMSKGREEEKQLGWSNFIKRAQWATGTWSTIHIGVLHSNYPNLAYLLSLCCTFLAI